MTPPRRAIAFVEFVCVPKPRCRPVDDAVALESVRRRRALHVAVHGLSDNPQDERQPGHGLVVLEVVVLCSVEEAEGRVREVEHEAVDLREEDEYRCLVPAGLMMLQRLFDEPIPSDHQISRLFVATSKRDYGSDGVAKVGHTVIPPTGHARIDSGKIVRLFSELHGLYVGVAVRPTRRRSPSELRELGGGLQPRDVRGVRRGGRGPVP